MIKAAISKKFKKTQEKDVLHLPWPSHIPDHCPSCDAEMNYKVNLLTTRSKMAHLIRAIAPWLSVVIFVSILILMHFVPPSFVQQGQGTPMAFAAIVSVPPTIITILANCIPKVIKLQCHRCNFNKDFLLPPIEPLPLNESQVKEMKE